MLTKYFIETDGIKAEVPNGCLKNWDEIQCVFKRTEFSGITRSFSSQFEFVGEMYDKLMALYLRDGVNAVAILTLCSLTNNWEWEEQFSCELDFSTLEWDNYVLKMNCIDDSLAAAIKARKSTKYEFVVGEDIPVSETLNYNRITMSNSVNHAIMSNGDETDGGRPGMGHKDGSVVITESSKLKRLTTYVVGDAETYENSPVLFGDEEDESGSYFLKLANSASSLLIDIEINFLSKVCPYGSFIKDAEIQLMRFDAANPNINSNYVNLGTIFRIQGTSSDTNYNRTCVGCYPSLDALKRAYPDPPQNVYAFIGKSSKRGEFDAVYFTPVTLNRPTEWVPGNWAYAGGRGNYTAYCNEYRFLSSIDLSNQPAGSMFALVYKCSIGWDHWWTPATKEKHFAIKSKIATRWESRAKSISINALRPQNVLNTLIRKIAEDSLNVIGDISNTDARASKTYLFAAESLRDIPGAKFYTTFKDFCEWMESVFGYTYYLGPRMKAPFHRLQEYSLQWTMFPYMQLLHTMCPGGHSSQVVLIEGTPYFAVLGDDHTEEYPYIFYTKWEGSEAYNDPDTGKARLDTVFYDEYEQGVFFDSDYNLKHYSGDVSRAVRDSQTIHFVPRSEIFAGDKIVPISNARDVEYSVNDNIAYSAVTAGYDKQEYEAECGRDEWNFSAQYTTGINKMEKKLSLVSKYRADCYGFEFLSQERAKDTTDNKSDNTVFFAHCRLEETEQDNGSSETRADDEEDSTTITRNLYIDRTAAITGALSADVFNGEYAPYRCILANAAYIAAAMAPMTLKFASFDGNTDVSIDGIKGNADLQLKEQLFTIGELSFSSPDVDTELDVNALYEVHSNGITYRGFLKEVSFKYAKAETVKYKLIVKEIIQ